MPKDIHGILLNSKDWETIKETINICRSLSRTEIAATLCEHMGWYRANKKGKTRECLEWLDRLSEKNLILLPQKMAGRPKGQQTRVARSSRGEPTGPIITELANISPIHLKLVREKPEHQFWNELMDRHHYLGFKTPYGAHLKYLVTSNCGKPLACLQFSSPARRVQPRDEFIGWDDKTRKKNLQKIVQNSRFLILPWVKVKNLASCILAKASSQLSQDWHHAFGQHPVLLETFVEKDRFQGTCYRAANWIYLGETKGRGRMDIEHKAAGSVKSIWIYPLSKALQKHFSEPSHNR